MISISKNIGNVLDIESGIIVHGCNSHGVMGSGIALEIKQRFPGAFATYRTHYINSIHSKGYLPVGEISVYKVNDNKIIVNAITQQNFGSAGITMNTVFVDYDAINKCFKQVHELALETGLDVHFPLIGCGLARGSWDKVEPEILNTYSDSSAHSLNLWLLPS